MKITDHHVFPEVKIIDLDVYPDNRGLFQETFVDRNLRYSGISEHKFVQDNMSVSKYNTFRGMHFQAGEYAQDKYIIVVNGEINDIFTCIDPKSPKFGQTSHVSLTVGQAIFLPRTFAHGFIARQDNTIICYKVTNYFNKESERTIKFSTLPLGIDSQRIAGINQNDIEFFNSDRIIISDKDRNSTPWEEIKKELNSNIK